MLCVDPTKQRIRYVVGVNSHVERWGAILNKTDLSIFSFKNIYYYSSFAEITANIVVFPCPEHLGVEYAAAVARPHVA